MPAEEWRLSEEFWSEFVGEYWEKKPTVIPKPFAREIISQAEALTVLRRGFVDPDPNLAMRRFFYIDRKLQEDAPAELLPREHETSIPEFTDRLRNENALRNYQFTIYNTQRWVPELFFRTRAAFAPLLDLVGLPAYQFNTDMFFGEYVATAGGLHKDNAGVFSFVAYGAKKMLVWPFEYFAGETDNPNVSRERENLPHVDYTQHLDTAIELTGEPGDVLYWPSSYWHTAVGDGRPHMTFNMSPYFPIRASDWLDQILSPMVREALGEDDWLSFLPYKRENLQQLAQQLPAAVAKVQATYQEVLSSNRLHNILMGAWLRSLSGFGFQVPPPPDADAAVREEERYAGDSEFPVLHVAMSQTQRVIAANGQLFVVPAGPALEHVLAVVNSGTEFSLEELLDRIGADPAASGMAGETLRKEVMSHLQKLLSIRALRPVGQTG